MLADHVLTNEGVEQVLATASEVLGMAVEPQTVEWPEGRGGDNRASVSGDATNISEGLGVGRPALPFGFRSGQQVLVISTLICVLSFIMSYVVLSRRPPAAQL